MHTSTFILRALLLLSGAVSLLTSCAPPPQSSVRFTPVAVDSSFMDDGREFVTLQKDSVQLAAAFDRCDDQYLIFNVEIINQSSRPVTIDPVKFYYQLQDTSQQIQYANGWQVPVSYAFSPDQEVIRLEQEIKREEARLKAKRVFWTVFAVAATVATVAVIAENNSKSSRNRESSFQRANTDRTVINAWALTMDVSSEAARSSVGNYYAKTENLESQKETWEKYPMRGKTLQPGERLYGDVVFKPHVGTGLMQFVFPVESQQFVIQFNQMRETAVKRK